MKPESESHEWPTQNAEAAPRCPTCEYNLTGLREARCPECGSPFDWEHVRQLAAQPATIAFEKARGIKRTIGFVVTSATVLFAPWLFARQACAHVNLRSGIVFAAICCMEIPILAIVHSELPSFGAWLVAVWIHIIAQAALLSLIDPSPWREFWTTLKWWAAIGGYTSAVILLEFYNGPPLLSPATAWDALVNILRGENSAPNNSLLFNGIDWLSWTVLGLWLGGLSCCCWQRSRQADKGVASSTIRCGMAVVMVFFLYSVSAGWVGPCLWSLFGGSIGR